MYDMNRNRLRLIGAALCACLGLPVAAITESECRDANVLLKTGAPPDTCAFDLCGTYTSSAGFGRASI